MMQRTTTFLRFAVNSTLPNLTDVVSSVFADADGSQVDAQPLEAECAALVVALSNAILSGDIPPLGFQS